MKLKIALIIVAAILVASLAANINLYSMYLERNNMAQTIDAQMQANSDLQAQVTDIQNQAAQLQGQIANLTAKANNLETENSDLLQQNTDLETQLNNLTDAFTFFPLDKPRLVTRLGVSNVIESVHGSHPRLFVEGDVFNTGGVTALGAKLEITLFIDGQVVNEYSYPLGDMESFGGAHVSVNVDYSGAKMLSNWTIVPTATNM
jgi:hypothetical protein